MDEKCSVCGKKADVEVFLYDVYPHQGDAASVFFEQDFTCSHLCFEHMAENENRAKGTRKPRGTVDYPYSNRNGAQGFTVYRRLDRPWPPPPTK